MDVTGMASGADAAAGPAGIEGGRMGRMHRIVPGLLAAAVVAACSPPAPPPAPQQARSEAPPARDLIAEVRSAAEGEDALEIQPLRDPAAEDWRLRALAFEREGRLDAAGEALERALQAAPEDPELLQLSAELALARGELDAAEQSAWRAFEQGPQVGPLCRRNWAAIRLARELRGNAEAADIARGQAERCAHQPPVRM